MKNKHAGTCKECGERVAPGYGDLTKEWDNQRDDLVWVVRHSDRSVCDRILAENAINASKAAAINNGIEWIKKNATEHIDEVKNGEKVLYDGRKGYNRVGWLLTRTDNTLYLSSENGSDGVRWDETYIYTASQTKIEDLLWTMTLC